MLNTLRIYIWKWKVKLVKYNFPLLATSHVGLEIVTRDTDGSESSYDYLSFWPEGFHLKPGWQDGVFNPGYGPERELSSVPHRYSDSVFMYYHRNNEKPRNQAPQKLVLGDWVFEAVAPREESISAMRAYIAALKSRSVGKLQYHIFLNNCSTLVAQALSLGGFLGNHVPCKRHLIWTPDKIRTHCLCLSTHGIFQTLHKP